MKSLVLIVGLLFASTASAGHVNVEVKADCCQPAPVVVAQPVCVQPCVTHRPLTFWERCTMKRDYRRSLRHVRVAVPGVRVHVGNSCCH